MNHKAHVDHRTKTKVSSLTRLIKKHIGISAI